MKNLYYFDLVFSY